MFLLFSLLFFFRTWGQDGDCIYEWPLTNTSISSTATEAHSCLYDVTASTQTGTPTYIKPNGNQSFIWIDSTDPACTSSTGSISRSISFSSLPLLDPTNTAFSIRWKTVQTIYGICSSSSQTIGKGYSIAISAGEPFGSLNSACTNPIAGFCATTGANSGVDSFALTFDWSAACGSSGQATNWIQFSQAQSPSPDSLAEASGFDVEFVGANQTYSNLLVWDGVSRLEFYMGSGDYNSLLQTQPFLTYNDELGRFRSVLENASDIYVGSTAMGCNNMKLLINELQVTRACGVPCLLAGCGEWIGGPNFGSQCTSADFTATASSRTCTCIAGKGVKSVATENITSKTTPASVCLDLDECLLYGCGQNADCSTTGLPLNLRECICQPGWVINASGTTVVGIENVTGSTAWDKCFIRRNLCAMYPCGASDITCTQPTFDTRRCTCPPGFATQSTDGVVPLADGSLPYTHQDHQLPDTGSTTCSFDIQECQIPAWNCSGVASNKTTTGSCAEQPTPNTRTCTCASPNNPPFVDYSGANVGGVFQGCYNQDLCTLYGCGNNQNVDCSNNADRISRNCTCRTGYSGTNTNLVTNAPFTSCYDTDECELYGCGSYSVACINQFNSRTCYCPNGTTPRVAGFTSELLQASSPATIQCDDIDECKLYGCPDNIGWGNATCTTGNSSVADLNKRTCTCVSGLVGTGVFVGDASFPGCKVPGINVAGSHTLGFTLADGYWNDWQEVLILSITKTPGAPPDFFATTVSKQLVGWMEASLVNTSGTASIDWTSHFDLSHAPQTCNGVFPYVYVLNSNEEQRPSFLCLDGEGNLIVFNLSPVGNDLVLQDAAQVQAGDVVLQTKMKHLAHYTYSDHTDVLFNQGEHMVVLTRDFDLNLDVNYTKATLVNVVFSPNPPGWGTVDAICLNPIMADLNKDGLADLVFINNNTFYWYQQAPPTSGQYNFQRIGWLDVTEQPQTFILIDYDNDGYLDLVAVTSYCYALYQIPRLYSKTGGQTVNASFDGKCTDCGCGFSTGIVAADFNSDNQLDLVVSLSGGAQILLNGGGVFSPQKILGGASVSAVVDMNLDGTPDILAVTSGLSVWYEITPPLACEENVHSCNTNQSCVTHQWDPPTCVCRTGYIEDPNLHICVDEDECARPVPPCAQTCENTIGSYICSCGSGFTLRPDGSCLDIPECATKPCTYICIELEGSYECACPKGYAPVTPNGSTIASDCEDIDECLIPGSCDIGSIKCTNYNGGYKCTCGDGYTPLSDTACAEKPCVWNNWDDWTNGACWSPETRTRTVDPVSSGSPNYACLREAATEYQFNYSLWCPAPTKPPINLRAGAAYLAQTLSDFYLDVIYPWPTQGLFPNYDESTFTYNYTANLVNHPLRRTNFGSDNSNGTACNSTISNCTNSTNSTTDTNNTGSKRAILPTDPSGLETGVFYFETDFCDPTALQVASEDIKSFTAYILQVKRERLDVRINIRDNNLSIPDTWYNLSDIGTLFGNFSTINFSMVDSKNATLTGGNCTILLDIRRAYDPDYTAIAIAVPLGVVAALLALVAGIYWWKHRELKKALKSLATLPKVVSLHYRDCIRHPEDWELIDVDPPSYRKLLTDIEDTNHVMEIFRKLDGHKIRVESIYAVYNPSLVTAMALTREKFENRVLHDAALFYAEKWKNDTGPRVILKRRQWVKDTFIRRVAEFTWNHELAVPIIPTIHGTAAAVAWKICHGGFATLSSLDVGFFGAGIYFTTSAKYAIPYFATKAQPAIIISYLVPGNPYPVIENPNREGSLAGEVIKAGYQSHYVLTTNRGMPFEKIEYKHIFDEIVVDQESQVAPAYVLLLDNKGFPALIRDFEKRTSEDDSANEDYDRD